MMMSAEDIKEVYKNLEEPFAEPYFLTGQIPIFERNKANYKARYATFKNITFGNLTHFEKTDLSIGLAFELCNFIETLVFEDVNTTGVDPLLNPKLESIVFTDCKFYGRVIFKGKANSLFGHLRFKDCIFEKGLEIEALKVIDGGVSLINCTIKEKLNIFNIEAQTEIQCSGDKVLCYTRFHNINCPALTFLDENVFYDCIEVHNCKLPAGIAFNDGTFKKEVMFSLVETSSDGKGLFISASTFERPVIVNYHSGKQKPTRGISQYYLVDAKFINGIYVNGTQDLFVDYPMVDEINLSMSAELKGNIEFRNLDVGILNMSGNNISANIFIEDVWVNQVKIKGLINNGGLILSRIKASYSEWYRDEKRILIRENAFYCTSSNFGKAQFFQTDFSSFGSIVFHHNILAEISTSLVTWFTPLQLSDKFEDTNKKKLKVAKKKKNEIEIDNARKILAISYLTKRETYRQLKFAMEKQGDKIQSLVFKAAEMGAFKKELQITKYWWSRDRFILWLSQSNDFGLNWTKPALLALSSAIIFYILLIISNSNQLEWKPATSCAEFHNTMKVWWENKKMIPQMLNPAHSMDDLLGKGVYISGFTYTIDYCYRLILTYFIYQTIVAFRKYSK